MKKIVLLLCALIVALGFTLRPTNVAAAAVLPDTLISEAVGEIVEEGKRDRVLLYGKHPNKGFFTEGIFIEVRDGATDDLIARFIPPVDSGYKPSVMLGKFTERKTEQIFLGVDSGGSGGFSFSYVFSAADKKPETLWNFERWDKSYQAQFDDGYRFTVKDSDSENVWTTDISKKNSAYLTKIFKEDGSLIAPLSGDVSGVNAVFPFYNSFSERFGLLITQSVTGLCRADGYGYVQHLARWDEGAFRSYFTTYNFNGTLVSS